MKIYRADADMDGKVYVHEWDATNKTPKFFLSNSWAKNSRRKALEYLITCKKIYIETLQKQIDVSKIAIANAEAMIMENEE